MLKIDVSMKMELSPATITQYLKGKRGVAFVDHISRAKEDMKAVSIIAGTLAGNNLSMERLIGKLSMACNSIRSEGTICELCQKNLRKLKECTLQQRYRQTS